MAKLRLRGRSDPSPIRDWLLFLALPVLERLLVAMPPRWVPRVGSAIGDCYRWAAVRERAIFERNATRVLGLEKGSAEFERLRRGVFRHVVVSMWETIQAFHRPELIVVEGLGQARAVFEAAEDRGRGQLLLTGHLGSWEMIEILVRPLLRGRFVELAKPARMRPLNKALEGLRRRAGTEVLWTRGSSYVRRMVEVLRHGHTLGLAMDQKPDQLLGPVAEFFGRPTEFVAGPAALIRRIDATPIFVCCARIAPYVYRLECEEIGFSETERRSEAVVTQRLASMLEKAIRRYPEQWPWTYRRWIFEEEPWGLRGRHPASSRS